MKRSFKKPRAKKVKPNAPVSPEKPDRPKRSNLRRIYKDFLTSDIDQRVTVLAQAMTWFDHVQAYLAYKQKGEWTLSQLKEKNAANQARTQGITTVKSEVKEKSYIKAVQHYEKMCSKFKAPLLKKVQAKLKSVEKKLEVRKSKLSNKYGEFLQLIRKVLQPKNPQGKRIDIRIDKLSHGYRIDAEGNVTLDRKIVANIKKMSRRQGLLPAVLQLFPVLSEAAAREEEKDNSGNKTGRSITSNRKRYNAVLEMLNCTVQFALLDKTVKMIRRPKRKRRSNE